MREFKFRVWDKSFKRMKVTGIGINAGMLDGDDVEIMQYTGLKDKNGKELYEGDIISNGTDKAEIKFGTYLTENLADGNGWYVLYNDFGIPLVNPNKAEVIGNIYETPELPNA